MTDYTIFNKDITKLKNLRKKIFPKEEKMKNNFVIPNFIAATKGDLDGEIDLTWEPVPNAYIYVIQMSFDNKRNSKWEQVDIIDKSSYTINKLKSGKKYKFRVAAVNSKGQGPWSEEVSKSAT
ncbi:MAG: fibronectin type III domain-containing protein [Ignavibacteriae bacterium]|nr:MAG: fibronectin type III domain-containing protein [Ignavibacteriota bacterium]